MARIPTKEELGGEQYASARQMPQFRTQDFAGTAAMGRAMGGAGEALQKVAVAAEARKTEADEYEVTNRLVQFDLEQEKRLDDDKRSANPEAKDFTKSYRDKYDESARTFMEAVPERIKPKVDALLWRRGANYEKRAYDFELAERDRYHTEDVNRRITDLHNDTTSEPGRKDGNGERGVAMIRASRLPINVKRRAEREFLERNDEHAARSAFERMAASGEDVGPEIERLRKMPKGTGLALRGATATRFAPEVDGAIDKAASETGVDPELLRSFARVESAGNPSIQTGSYKGVFQLSDAEFRKYGGTGSIFNPEQNAMAAARKVQAESQVFEKRHGRAPTATDLYLVHQQGDGGYAAHMENPDRVAWESMLSTGEGKQKGARWAKQAIWGNLTDEAKKQFGSVDNITSGAFVSFWDERLAGRAMNDPGGSYNIESGEAVRIDDSRDEPFEADDVPYRHLSPTTRRKLLNVARTAQRAVMAQKIEGAIVRVRRGEELDADEQGKTAFDKAVEHMAPMQRQQAVSRMHAARTFAQATRGMADMTAEDAEAAIDTVRVTAETPEDQVAAQDRAHRDAITLRNRLESLRSADPAQVVWRGDQSGRIQPAREVMEARNTIRALDKSDPDYNHKVWEATFDARVAAQRRTVPTREPRLLTKTEAQALIQIPDGMKFTDPKFRPILQKAADDASSRYGPAYARKAMQDAIRWTISGEDEKRISTGMLAKIAVGEPITRQDLRRERLMQDSSSFGLTPRLEWGPPSRTDDRDAEGQPGGYYGPPPIAGKPKPAPKRKGRNPYDDDD